MEQAKDILFGGSMILMCFSCFFRYAKAIIDIHKRKFVSYREKSLWLTVVVCTPVIGSIFYFFSKRQRAPFAKARL